MTTTIDEHPQLRHWYKGLEYYTPSTWTGTAWKTLITFTPDELPSDRELMVVVDVSVASSGAEFMKVALFDGATNIKQTETYTGGNPSGYYRQTRLMWRGNKGEEPTADLTLQVMGSDGSALSKAIYDARVLIIDVQDLVNGEDYLSVYDATYTTTTTPTSMVSGTLSTPGTWMIFGGATVQPAGTGNYCATALYLDGAQSGSAPSHYGHHTGETHGRSIDHVYEFASGTKTVALYGWGSASHVVTGSEIFALRLDLFEEFDYGKTGTNVTMSTTLTAIDEPTFSNPYESDVFIKAWHMYNPGEAAQGHAIEIERDSVPKVGSNVSQQFTDSAHATGTLPVSAFYNSEDEATGDVDWQINAREHFTPASTHAILDYRVWAMWSWTLKDHKPVHDPVAVAIQGAAENTTPEVMLGQTPAVKNAGKYLILAHMSSYSYNSGTRLLGRLKISGTTIFTNYETQDPATDASNKAAEGPDHQWCLVQTLAANDTVELWGSNLTGGANIIYPRRMDIIALPLDSLDDGHSYVYGQSSDSTAFSSTAQSHESVTLPASAGDNWIVFDFRRVDPNTTAYRYYLYLDNDGVILDNRYSMLRAKGSGDYMTYTRMYRIAGSASTQVLTQKFLANSASGTMMTHTYGTLFAIRESAFREVQYDGGPSETELSAGVNTGINTHYSTVGNPTRRLHIMGAQWDCDDANDTMEAAIWQKKNEVTWQVIGGNSSTGIRSIHASDRIPITRFAVSDVQYRNDRISGYYLSRDGLGSIMDPHLWSIDLATLAESGAVAISESMGDDWVAAGDKAALGSVAIVETESTVASGSTSRSGVAQIVQNSVLGYTGAKGGLESISVAVSAELAAAGNKQGLGQLEITEASDFTVTGTHINLNGTFSFEHTQTVETTATTARSGQVAITEAEDTSIDGQGRPTWIPPDTYKTNVGHGPLSLKVAAQTGGYKR